MRLPPAALTAAHAPWRPLRSPRSVRLRAETPPPGMSAFASRATLLARQHRAACSRSQFLICRFELVYVLSRELNVLATSLDGLLKIGAFAELVPRLGGQ